jgi:tetratricopeptide (TPR) repeat protein
MWSCLAHALLCLSAGVRFVFSKDPAVAKEAEGLGATALALAPDEFSRRLAWFWIGQARVLLDDLDGAIQALEKGAASDGRPGDMSFMSLALLAGVLHITGSHDEALTAAERAFRGARSHTGGLWAWALYCSLPYALELGRQGRDAEARAYMRELLVEGGTPRTPGVMTSALIVLGALAVQRGEDDAARILLDFAGRAFQRDGIRTPVDLALYIHYLKRLGAPPDTATGARYQDIAERMSVDEAIAYGLDGLMPRGVDG